MKAGSLKHSLIIEKPIRIKNEFGETPLKDQSAWETIGTARAAIYTLDAKETNETPIKAQHVISHDIRMRYRNDITADCRLVEIKADSVRRVFDIIGVINIGDKNKELKIQVKERDAQGS